MTITPAQEPGILIETTWDAHGDIDRISFLAEVVDGKQKVVQVLPKLGKLDRKALAKSLHGMTIAPKDEPGILIETTWDAKGDIDRISFLVEVTNGKQKVVETLPKLGK